MDWTRSLQITWRYCLVDPQTWIDTEALDSVSSCTVTWDSSTETLLSGALEVDVTFPENECYVRAWCDVTQSRKTERYPVATMLCQASKDASEGTKRKFSVEAYSPLLELADDQPPVGWAVSGEVDDAIRIICSHMRAPLIEYESDVVLTSPIVAGDDDTWLTMLWAVLDSADLTMLIDGMGRLRIEPKSAMWSLSPVMTLSDTDERGILWADMSRETSLFGIPNKLEAIWSGGDEHYSSVATNEDPSSQTSIPVRGRVVSVRETNPEGLMANPTQQAVDDYAQRRLRELSVVTRTYELRAGYMPLWIGMAVKLELSKLGANEVACIDAMEIHCDVEAAMDLTITSTRELWGGANG